MGPITPHWRHQHEPHNIVPCACPVYFSRQDLGRQHLLVEEQKVQRLAMNQARGRLMTAVGGLGRCSFMA